MRFGGELTLGEIRYQEMLQFVEIMAQEAEHAVAESKKAAADAFPEIRPLQPRLERVSDRAVYAKLKHDFPQFSGFFDRFFFVESIASPVEDPNWGSVTAVDLQWRVRLTTLQKEFPLLFDRFRKLGRVAESQIILKNEKGQRIAKWRFRTEQRSARLQFFVKNGAFVPFDVDDSLIKGAQPFKLSEEKDRVLSFQQSFSMEAYGIRIVLDNLHGKFFATRKKGWGEAKLKLLGFDRLEVTGRVLGIIPLSVVDVFVPGSIEGSLRDMLNAAARGFQGAGSEIAIRFDNAQGPTKPSRFQPRLQAIIIENKFFQFSMKVSGSRFLINDPESAEMARIFKEAYTRLKEDYQAERLRLLGT